MIAVVPCWNRPGELPPLLQALRGQISTDAEFSVIIVDNASEPTIQQEVEPPPGLDVRFLRLPENQGGSGGFNAGIAEAISGGADLVWLLDSDAVPEPDCLTELLAALRERPDASAAGSALADPATAEPYEFGGEIDPRSGELTQHARAASDTPFEVGYNAACSLLVRASAVRAVGLMPDLFISGDDAAWCRHLAIGFGPVLCAPGSRVRHPHPARMRTLVRYYQARNGVTNSVRFGLLPIARARRVLKELLRASAQRMVGRDDLARLHLEGVRSAWAHPAGRAEPPPFEPYQRPNEPDEPAEPARGVRMSPAIAFARWLFAPRRAVAVVDARAHPGSWTAAKRVITTCDAGVMERSVSRRGVISGLALDTLRFGVLAVRAALDPPAAPPPPRACEPIAEPGLSIVLLTHGARAERALHTLAKLAPARTAAHTDIVLVCNGGVGPLPEHLHDDLPVRVLRLGENLGVDGFNRGVRAATDTGADMVLILDDDAWPDPASLERAVRLIARGKTDAVSFARRHPATKAWEWPGERAPQRSEAWPDMGCCNLVRTGAWQAVGGYEPAYFLYRNDTDLALSLLGAGYRVRFERDLFAWHDSPVVGRQHPAWFRLATRNWVWMCRRHARGLGGAVGVLAGWAWAHKQAGRRPACHAMAIRGFFEGVLRPAPALRGSVRASDGSAFGSLISLKLRGRVRQTPAASPAPGGSPAPAE